MNLEEVRRRTPGKVVCDTLKGHACTSAIVWMENAICERPKITAQGLWNTCYVGEWLEWLVIELAHFEDHFAMEDIAGITGSRTDGWLWPKGDLSKHFAVAEAIRAQYESPWLP